MRVVFAPDSYGGFLSAPAACRLLQRVLALRGLAVAIHPMADGGEGSLDVLRFHGLAQRVEFVESAAWLGPGEPGMVASWQERTSVALGVRLARCGDGPVLVGLGGTATMDGGAGALQALGLRLLDLRGRSLPAPLPAGELGRVRRVAGARPFGGTLLEVLRDVSSPLGRAATLYGPQKGMQAREIPSQRSALESWGRALQGWCRRGGQAPPPLQLAGGGAAGGLGFALACCGARLVPGAERIARLTGLRSALAGAGVVVLGEGCMDATSFEGKVAQVVLQQARALGVPRVAALVGSARSLPPAPEGPDEVVEAGEPSMEAFLAAIESLAVLYS